MDSTAQSVCLLRVKNLSLLLSFVLHAIFQKLAGPPLSLPKPASGPGAGRILLFGEQPCPTWNSTVGSKLKVETPVLKPSLCHFLTLCHGQADFLAELPFLP